MENTEFREVINAAVRAELNRIRSEEKIVKSESKTQFEDDKEYYDNLFKDKKLNR